MQRVLVAVAGFALAASLVPQSAIADTQVACRPITEKQVAGLFDRWDKTLETKNPDAVTANYTRNATLLPTVQNGPLIGTKQIQAYFVTFVKQSPRGKIDEHVIHIGCNIAYDIGLYTFEVDGDSPGVRQQIKARYTFVYVPENGKWLIAHHHSSKVPE